MQINQFVSATRLLVQLGGVFMVYVSCFQCSWGNGGMLTSMGSPMMMGNPMMVNPFGMPFNTNSMMPFQAFDPFSWLGMLAFMNFMFAPFIAMMQAMRMGNLNNNGFWSSQSSGRFQGPGYSGGWNSQSFGVGRPPWGGLSPGAGFNPGSDFNPGSSAPFSSVPGNSTQEKMMNMARNFVGMHERQNRGTLGRFLGFDPTGTPWCAGWINALHRNTTGKIPPWGNTLSARGIEHWGRRSGNFLTANHARSGNLPQIGDVLVVRSSKAPSGRHVAMVSEVNNGQIKIIEGNSSNRVVERAVSLYDSDIVGFVRSGLGSNRGAAA